MSNVPDFTRCDSADKYDISFSRVVRWERNVILLLMGLHIVQPDPAELARQIAAGSRFIAYGIDSVFLWQAAERPNQGE